MNEIKLLKTAALWYAWGQIDAGAVPDLNTDHGFEFMRLYGVLCQKFEDGTTNYRPSVLSAWHEFRLSKARLGASALLTAEDLEYSNRLERELVEQREALDKSN